MANLAIRGLDELDVHLQEVVKSPDITLDLKLVDEVSIQLTSKSHFAIIMNSLICHYLCF